VQLLYFTPDTQIRKIANGAPKGETEIVKWPFHSLCFSSVFIGWLEGGKYQEFDLDRAIAPASA
jgi:hypothetical protein